MTRVEMIEDLFEHLKSVESLYYNAFNGNIFEMAVYLYMRYGEIPIELGDEEKDIEHNLEKLEKILNSSETLFNSEINERAEELFY